jgi:hypothetical protein
MDKGKKQKTQNRFNGLRKTVKTVFDFYFVIWKSFTAMNCGENEKYYFFPTFAYLFAMMIGFYWSVSGDRLPAGLL